MNNFTPSIYTQTFTWNLFVITKFSRRKPWICKKYNYAVAAWWRPTCRQRPKRCKTSYQGFATTKLSRLQGHKIIIIKENSSGTCTIKKNMHSRKYGWLANEEIDECPKHGGCKSMCCGRGARFLQWNHSQWEGKSWREVDTRKLDFETLTTSEKEARV